MAPVAPVAELEAIYDRIVAQEIVMKDDKLAAARGQGPAKPSKLAAAIGFAHLAQPFRWAALQALLAPPPLSLLLPGVAIVAHWHGAQCGALGTSLQHLGHPVAAASYACV